MKNIHTELYIDDFEHHKTADMNFNIDEINKIIGRQVEEVKFKEAELELLEGDEKIPFKLIEKKQAAIELLYKNIMELEKRKNEILKRTEDYYNSQGKEIRV